MAAVGSQSEFSRREEHDVARVDAGTASTRMRVRRSIGVKSAAVCGALLSGLVAFAVGIISLLAFGLKLAHAGFFERWTTGFLFSMRSLVGLIIVILLTAATGASMWAVAAYIYNLVAGANGRQQSHSARARDAGLDKT
jgi:hypothetical protein